MQLIFHAYTFTIYNFTLVFLDDKNLSLNITANEMIKLCKKTILGVRP